jgi:hypothetical protein
MTIKPSVFIISMDTGKMSFKSLLSKISIMFFRKILSMESQEK